MLKIDSSGKIIFPPLETQHPEGPCFYGLQWDVLSMLSGYSQGYFPWGEKEGQPIWYCPHPRWVFYPLREPTRNWKRLMKKNDWQFSENQCFDQVISYCQTINRPLEQGTWITSQVLQVFQQLHKIGYAHSVEVWDNSVLIGGLYGLLIGGVFFGESMFSLKLGASKAALGYLLKKLIERECILLDCQQPTQHTQALGAGFISGKNYRGLLEQFCKFG